MRASSVVWVLGALSVGCSWSRYDEVTKNTPIVLLNRPKKVDGFGSSLASAREGDDAVLLVGGSPLSSGGAVFRLGSGDAPGVEAIDTGHCSGGDAPCYLSPTPAALARAKGPSSTPEDLCFVDGAGPAGEKGDIGVAVRCTDAVEYALPIPSNVKSLLSFSLENNQPTAFRFGADRGPDPALLASADEETSVWYYPPLSRSFVALPNPADARGRWAKASRTLAIARVGGDARLLAIGSPDKGSVRLFAAPDGATPSYIGCLGGTQSFGRALATGPVEKGDTDDLVISDADLVYVFDGKKLAALPPASGADCSLGSLPEGSLITSFTCGSTKNISDCPTSDFGAALAVGDLDGDGDGEVVVGAPSMTVRHKSRAGAVLIYDVETGTAKDPANLYDLKDIAFLSSAETDDQLGLSLALPNLGDRQLLVAGAPGGGKAALFYCPSFLPADLAGARCR
jgi:hypothetical protein